MNTQAAIEKQADILATEIVMIAHKNCGILTTEMIKHVIVAELKQAELLGYKRGRLSAHDEYRILLSELSEKKEHIFSPNRSFPEVCTICGNFEFNSVHIEDKNTK